MEIEYIATSEGSLGLLALGDIGVTAWKEALKKEREEEKKLTTEITDATENDKKINE